MPVRGKAATELPARAFPDCAGSFGENRPQDREEWLSGPADGGFCGRRMPGVPRKKNVLCGLHSAYCQRGTVSQAFFDLTHIYYHRLQWVDDFKAVEDQILKFAPTVRKKRPGTTTTCSAAGWRAGSSPTSGHGSIDLILPAATRPPACGGWWSGGAAGAVRRLRGRGQRHRDAALLRAQLRHGEAPLDEVQAPGPSAPPTRRTACCPPWKHCLDKAGPCAGPAAIPD